MPTYRRPWQHADRSKTTPVQPPGLRPLNDGAGDWRTQGPAAEVLAMPAPEPRPKPVLEINRRPLADLRALIEKIGEPRLCFELNIHRTTVRRWLKGEVQLPGHQHQVIRLLLGDLPGTEGRWRGWRFWKGKLLSPAGEAFEAGQVLSLVLLRQQLTAQRQEIEALKTRLQIAEKAVEVLTPAANESRAWG